MKRFLGLFFCFALLSPSSAFAGKAVGKERFMAQMVATSFVRAVIGGQIDTAVPLCAPRVSFDGRWVEGEKPLRAALSRVIARARRVRLRLRTVEVLSHAEMVGRYGPAPSRLKGAIGKSDLFALALFGRLGMVVGLERQGRLFRVKLLSD